MLVSRLRLLRWCRKRLTVTRVALMVTIIIVTGFISMHIDQQNSRYGKGNRRHIHGKSGRHKFQDYSPEQCTPEEISSNGKKIVLTSTNAAYLDFTNNWLESIRRTEVCPNITIVAEDDATVTYYSNKTSRYPGLTVVKTDSGATLSNHLIFDSESFKKFVNKRQSYILSLLLKGFEILFTDVDTYWFKDPFFYFKGDFDIAVEEDKEGFYCAGFVYFKPSQRTVDFLQEWIKYMHQDKNLLPDQVVMNRLIKYERVPDLKIKVLSSTHFPNGKTFFNRDWRLLNAKHIAVAHNNWIIGHDKKVDRFKKFGMWLIGSNSTQKTWLDV